MASNGEELMNVKLGERPKLGLGREEEEFEDETEAGAMVISGLIGNCVELSLVGGVEGGGFTIPGLRPRAGGGLAAGSSAAGGSGSRGGSASSVLVQGYGLGVRLVNDAHKVFDESPVRDLVSYNSLINGYAQKHQDSCLRPDEFTFVAMLSAFSSFNEPKVAKQIHCLVYRYQCLVDSNILLKTTIIDMYAKCGLMNIAEKVFSSMETSKGMKKKTGATSMEDKGFNPFLQPAE